MQMPDTSIVLRNEKIGFSPTRFYISDIVDERKVTIPTARVVGHKKGGAIETLAANLKGGDVLAIKNFIQYNLDQNNSARPILLTLKQLSLSENGLLNGKIAGSMELEIGFGLQSDYGVVTPLLAYKGGLKYTRSPNQNAETETIIRRGIINALNYFNNWINIHALSDIRLATAIKLSFTDFTEQPEGDTIYYTRRRPLTWADFKDKPRAGNLEAEVFPGIGYSEETRVDNGSISLMLSIKVYVPKSASWARGGMDNYALNHEQRHFDIAKIVAEHFKQKLIAMHLPILNYDGYINEQYLETLREETTMQKRYDNETHHGGDRDVQLLWDEKIDRELKLPDVK